MARRRAAKVDSNQAEIVAELRRHAYGVLLLHAVGGGCPDLLVSTATTDGGSVNVLLEVKDGGKSPSARRLSDDQVRFHAEWPGPVHTVETPGEALAVMRPYRHGASSPETPYTAAERDALIAGVAALYGSARCWADEAAARVLARLARVGPGVEP